MLFYLEEDKGFLDSLTVGGMKRWGVRATILSSYTELNAWQNACITT